MKEFGGQTGLKTKMKETEGKKRRKGKNLKIKM